MPGSSILFQKKENIGWIILNRPRTGNIINLPMAQELKDICANITEDSDVYAVIITASGKAFCLGSELEQKLKNRLKYGLASYHPVASAIAAIEKPVIAALNGATFGQGLEIALACDIRIAAETARFGFPNVSLGLIPIDGGTQRLPRIIGKAAALEMIFNAGIITARQANRIGLVNAVVAKEGLIPEVTTIGQSMTKKAPLALRYIKEAINKGLDLTLEQGLRLEADLYFLLHTTTDRIEGIQAFQQKRLPRFTGR